MMMRNHNEILIQKHCRQTFISLPLFFFNLPTSIKQRCISYYRALMQIWLLQQFVWATSVSFPPLSVCFSLKPQSLSVSCAVWLEYLIGDRTQCRIVYGAGGESGDAHFYHNSCQKEKNKNAHLYPASPAERCHVRPIPSTWLNHVKYVPGDRSRWSTIQTPCSPPSLTRHRQHTPRPSEAAGVWMHAALSAPRTYRAASETEHLNQAEITPMSSRF